MHVLWEGDGQVLLSVCVLWLTLGSVHDWSDSALHGNTLVSREDVQMVHVLNSKQICTKIRLQRKCILESCIMHIESWIANTIYIVYVFKSCHLLRLLCLYCDKARTSYLIAFFRCTKYFEWLHAFLIFVKCFPFILHVINANSAYVCHSKNQ